jgi:hypothetical protein
MVSAWKSIVNAAPDSIAETIHFPFRHELPPTFIIFCACSRAANELKSSAFY